MEARFGLFMYLVQRGKEYQGIDQKSGPEETKQIDLSPQEHISSLNTKVGEGIGNVRNM